MNSLGKDFHNPYGEQIVCHCFHRPLNGEGVSRREVLLSTAVAGLAGGLFAQTARAKEFVRPVEPQAQWPKVRVAFMRPREKYWLGWPGTAFPLEDYVAKSRKLTEQFAKELNIRLEFAPEPIYDETAAGKWAEETRASDADAALLFPLHFQEVRSKGTLGPMIASGKPTIAFVPLGMCFTSHVRNFCELPRLYLASSPDFELGPVRFGLKMVRTNHNIRHGKIAVLRGNETKEERLEPFGLTIRYLPRDRFVEALQSINPAAPEVTAMADEYSKAAQKIVEPKRTDLLNAARNYYAAVKIMNDEGCTGISMDCLGAVYDKNIPCPPCLAWSKLLDQGIPGVCEADINAVMGHTLCCELLDRPGFMQDPVPNTDTNTLIGAHCVCGTRLNGYDQAREPFVLRSHSESDIGVSVQVLWKEGQEVTVMQMTAPDTMILGKGKVLRNYQTPPAGGCRTSVDISIDAPEDVRATKGFHQLFIYGDHVRQFKAYAQMYDLKTEHI